MINTNELMLGNLVEYKGQYVIVDTISQYRIGYRTHEGKYNDADCSRINPIELTDDVLNKLGIPDCNWKYIHQLQNRRILLYEMPFDITPLLKPKPILTTHDGVEVSDKDARIYSVYKTGVCPFEGDKDNPTIEIVCKLNLEKCGDLLFFSTRELAQAYLNKVWAENEYQSLLKSKSCQNR